MIRNMIQHGIMQVVFSQKSLQNVLIKDCCQYVLPKRIAYYFFSVKIPLFVNLLVSIFQTFALFQSVFCLFVNITLSKYDPLSALPSFATASKLSN